MTRLAAAVDPDRLSGAIALYSLIASALCFWGIGYTGMIHMEGIVGDGARTMLHSGDWLVPRVFGEVYTYKPALSYWLSALPHAIADPPPMWLLRLPFAASGFAMGLVVLLVLARVTSSRIALLSSLASISGGLFIQKVRLAEFDSVLAAGVGAAVVAACANLADERPRAGLWLLGYLGLGLAFLAKGVPALMFYGPGLVSAALATRRLHRLFDWRHLTTALLFPLVVGAYLLAAYQSAGMVVFEQPFQESKLRALGWDQRQEGPTLSAVEGADTSARPIDTVTTTVAKPLNILTSFFPVSLLVPFAFVKARGTRRPRVEQLLLRSAAAFLLAGVAVFMAVPAHENRYYLPLSAAIGVLAGVVLGGQESLGPGARRGLLLTTAAAAGLATLAMILLGLFMETPPVPWSNRALLLAGGVPALSLVILTLRRPSWNRAVVLVTLAVVGLLSSEVLATQIRRASKRALKPQALALASYLAEDTVVWVLGPADLAGKSASLLYNLGRRIETFRPGVRLPPAGSTCLIPSDRLYEIEGVAGFAFEEIARESDPWRSYLLGRCSGPAPG